MWQALCELGCISSYGCICTFVRLRKIREGLAAAAEGAFMPLKCRQGEIFEFVWSTEYSCTHIGGIRRRVGPAHTELYASRAFWLVAYSSQGLRC